jgi:hypothetical protein
MMSTLMTSASETVTYLAGLSGDGTSNNAVMGIVNRVIGAAAIGVAGFFAWKMLHLYFTTDLGKSGGSDTGRAGPGGGGATGSSAFGGPKTKTLLNEAVAFMVAEGLIASIWALVNYGQQIIGGVT